MKIYSAVESILPNVKSHKELWYNPATLGGDLNKHQNAVPDRYSADAPCAPPKKELSRRAPHHDPGDIFHVTFHSILFKKTEDSIKTETYLSFLPI